MVLEKLLWCECLFIFHFVWGLSVTIDNHPQSFKDKLNMHFLIPCISSHFFITVHWDIDKNKYWLLLLYRSFQVASVLHCCLFCNNCMLLVFKSCLRKWVDLSPAVFVEFFDWNVRIFFFSKCKTTYYGVFTYFVFIWFTARPNPPFDLELTGQLERSITLSWIPGDENNSPITSMFVSTTIQTESVVLTVLKIQIFLE